MDDRALVAQMVLWLENHLTIPVRGGDLERASGYSENRLRQKFYAVTGETPTGYLRKRRLSESARALMDGTPIVQVASDYCYSSQDNFTTAFRAWFGITPGDLRTLDRKYRNFLTRLKEPMNIMELANLTQEPINTTLMSCMKGACDYWDLDWSMSDLFGYSGHAFMINIHPELCPSGPYAWNKDRFFLAMRNLGLVRRESYWINAGESDERRLAVESRIRAHLDAGKLCVLDFLEHQLISGYDAGGFIFLRPWNGCASSELPSLSFGTWNEALSREGWVSFTLLDVEDRLLSDRRSLLRDTLDILIGITDRPAEFRLEGYEVGQGAWAAWVSGVNRGLDRTLGGTHGHWWNGSVWTECRQMASSFFTDRAGDVSSSASARLCSELASLYVEEAGLLASAKEKDAGPEVQIAAFKTCAELELKAVSLAKELLVLL